MDSNKDNLGEAQENNQGGATENINNAPVQPVQSQQPAQQEQPVQQPVQNMAQEQANNQPVQATNNQTQQPENIYVEKTKTAVKDIMPFVKQYWSNPMGATINLVKNQNNGLIIALMVIFGLAQSLTLFSLLYKVTDTFGQLSSSFLKLDIETPVIASGIAGFLIAVVVIALIAGATWLVLKIGAINFPPKDLVVAAAVNTIPLSVVLILASVTIFLDLYKVAVVLIVLYFFAMILIMILMPIQVFGLQFKGLNMLVMTVILAVAVSANIGVAGRMSMYGFTSIKVEGETLGKMYKGLVEDIEDFVDDLMDFDLLDLMQIMM